jgi:ABC-2 type transport system ATP-binding protein
MSEYVLRTKKLTKRYKSDYALMQVDLNIKKGDIYGFIGQNGAGKSTLLRIVTGMAKASDGEVELFGNSDHQGLVNARKRMGAIVETPALFLHMTAEQNLEVCRLQRGIPGKECIQRTLSLVGLEDTARKKVKNFSLGMKQRLGLAIALLGDPEFLILDEPTNGLDPMGIVELRDLLKKLNREKGMTVFISSHILAELHQLATTYGIIHNGQLLEQLSAKELNEHLRKFLLIKVNEVEKAVAVMEMELGTTDFEVMQDGTIRLYGYLNEAGRISKLLHEHGIILEQLTPISDDLESYFTRLVGGGHHE